MVKQSQYWCLEWNNYPEDHLVHLSLLPAWTYRIISYEHAPSTGTPHIHIYIEFEKKQRFTTLQKLKLFTDIQPRGGTAEQARKYCTPEYEKDGPSEHSLEEGEISVPKQGTRTDLIEFCDKLKKEDLEDVIFEHPEVYVKYHRGLEALKFKLSRKQDKLIPEVLVFWGDTGTGKSKSVLDKSPDCFFTSNCQWYDGWNGQTDICYEEYTGQIAFDNFLRLIDRYKVDVQVKGSTVYANPKRVFITSHYHPRMWYPDHENRFPELWRRITVCQHYMSVRSNLENVRVIEVAGNTKPLQSQITYIVRETPPDTGCFGDPKRLCITDSRFEKSPQRAKNW